MGFTHNDTHKKLAFEALQNGSFPLYTQAALCERWGVDRSRVRAWRRQFDDFPQPVEGIVLGGGPYFAAHEVEAFEQGKNFNPNRKQGNPNAPYF
jgi:hypothetical protein